jgi:CubicO group peptidase (beta-lactamase class C family)
MIPRGSLGPAAGRWRSFNPFYLDGAAYGGLVGPVEDAALLAATHLGGGVAPNGTRILTTETAEAMRRIDHAGKRFDLGLGWFRRHRDSRQGRRHVEHLGGGGGFGSVMRLWPDQDFGVVAMGNITSNHFRHERLLARLSDQH